LTESRQRQRMGIRQIPAKPSWGVWNR